MMRGKAPSHLGRTVLQALSLALAGGALSVVVACGAGPPPDKYVLGSAPVEAVSTRSEAGLPVVEVRRVQISDYLDTSDLLERNGNELVPSLTGLWGERLSVGMGRALTAALAAKLPQMVVMATPPLDRPAQRVFLEVTTFEPNAEHQVVLIARWSITDGTSGQVLDTKQTSLVEPINGTGDAAVVDAMSTVVEKLADQIAPAVERTSRTSRVTAR
jgi:uncharacterized lipoprotein YmbA